MSVIVMQCSDIVYKNLNRIFYTIYSGSEVAVFETEHIDSNFHVFLNTA